MNINEFNVLAERGEVNLAAAYAIMMNCGESALLHSFEDMINITNRIKVAEKLIENERDSELKTKVEKRIEWYKNNITIFLTTFKARYASIMAARRAYPRNLQEFYDEVIKVIDSKDEYVSFFDWIDAINWVV